MEYLGIFLNVFSALMGVVAVGVVGVCLVWVAGTVVEWWHGLGDGLRDLDEAVAATAKMFDDVKYGKTSMDDLYPDRAKVGDANCPDCRSLVGVNRGSWIVLADKLWCAHCRRWVEPVWSAVVEETVRHVDDASDDDLGMPMHPAMAREVAKVLGEELDKVILTADNYASPSKANLDDAIDVVIVELKRHGVKMKMSPEALANLEFMNEEGVDNDEK